MGEGEGDGYWWCVEGQVLICSDGLGCRAGHAHVYVDSGNEFIGL